MFIAKYITPTSTVTIVMSPHLMLLYDNGPNLCCNHRDNGGDVIFKSFREAAPSGDNVLVKTRHMLSHAFHLYM